jgi:hypothetical protein
MFPNNNNETYPQFPCTRHHGQFTYRVVVSSFTSSREDILNLSYYAILVGGANGDLDLLELTDGRSYESQCRPACRSRQAENCMGEGLLTGFCQIRVGFY